MVGCWLYVMWLQCVCVLRAECVWSVHERHPGSVGSQTRYWQRSSTRLDLTCSGDLNFLRARMENCEVPDCALVMREGENDEE